MSTLDLSHVDRIVADCGTTVDRVLPILQALQRTYGYLPREALERVCASTEIRPAAITGFSSFYDQFRFTPAGEHTVRVCIGTACHVKGAPAVVEAFRRHLRIPADDDTDPEGRFTVAKVACLGCCTLAPAVQIGDVTYGHLTPDRVASVVTDFLQRERRRAREQDVAPPVLDGDLQGEVRVGLGSCCQARGSAFLNRAVERALAETGIRAAVKHVGCVGMCYQTPLMEIVLPDGKRHLYARVEPDDAKAILLRHFKAPRPTGRLTQFLSRGLDHLLEAGQRPAVTRYGIHARERHVADFLGRQRHLASEHCGVIHPTDIDEYLAKEGFTALRRAVTELSPEAVIAEIEASGLRGRGGAGFPTGRKWRIVHEQPAGERFVVCNGDEGDPGAFMDRMLMESYPLRVLEGLAIAARAVGAQRGFIYIRAEYPLAIERMSEAIERCRERGFLGTGICGSDLDLDLQIVPGAGAFVCGEETALLASIMGRRGMPRLRPPYPAAAGLWGRPTLINNVETYALVSWILRQGAEAFAALGTAESKGTKVFALAGKVARGGLIEVPMGITLRQIVEEIGGGVADGHRFKAVQVGGPSGGCVPEHLADIAVDYESLTAAGAIMGSGGLVVLDETDCMVDMARYFLAFTQDQSCGKCTFCRVGTRRMLEILDGLCEGRGKAADLQALESLARQVIAGSLCALGGTAPNPVLSTLTHFRHEYEAHVAGRCPAGKCTALIRFRITDACIGCTLCAQRCPTDAIALRPYAVHEIDPEACVRCGTCKTVCPEGAVVVE